MRRNKNCIITAGGVFDYKCSRYMYRKYDRHCKEVIIDKLRLYIQRWQIRDIWKKV